MANMAVHQKRMQVSLEQQRSIWFRNAIWFFFRYLFASMLVANFLASFLIVEWMSQLINAEAAAGIWVFGFLEWPLELRFISLLPFTFLLSLPVACAAQGPYPRKER